MNLSIIFNVIYLISKHIAKTNKQIIHKPLKHKSKTKEQRHLQAQTHTHRGVTATDYIRDDKSAFLVNVIGRCLRFLSLFKCNHQRRCDVNMLLIYFQA